MKLNSLKFVMVSASLGLGFLATGPSISFAEDGRAAGLDSTAKSTAKSEDSSFDFDFNGLSKDLRRFFVSKMPSATLKNILKVNKELAGFATDSLLKCPDLAPQLDSLVTDLENEDLAKRTYAVKTLSRSGALSRERAIRLLELATRKIEREGGGLKFQAKLAAFQILREQFREDADPIKRDLKDALVALSLGRGDSAQRTDRIVTGVLVQMLGIDLPSESRISTEREALIREIEALRAQARAREGLLMAPSREDLVTHLDYVGCEDRGIIRLMPRGLYDSILQINQAGAYYSFFRLVHDYGYGSDLSLEQGQLRVGFAGADFGFLVKLGEVDLKDVSLEPLSHPALEFASAFVAPFFEAEARESYHAFGAGRTVGDTEYRNHFPAEVGQTYALRSVSYDRSDVLVVLKVLRQDTDGSLILIWKKLKDFAVPKLQRN